MGGLFFFSFWFGSRRVCASRHYHSPPTYKIIEGDLLKNIFGITPNAMLLGNGFGAPALLQTSFKPWCAARQTMAATQALREVLADGVTPDEIARIGVAVPPPHLKMINHGVTPGDRFSHLTSLQYQMAVAALTPDEADFPLQPFGAGAADRDRVHVAHPGEGGGGASRGRLSAGLASPYHRDGIPSARVQCHPRAGRSGAALGPS